VRYQENKPPPEAELGVLRLTLPNLAFESGSYEFDRGRSTGELVEREAVEWKEFGDYGVRPDRYPGTGQKSVE
jgi:hypothetical protein